MALVQNPSLPKEKIKFLLLEGIAETAVAALGTAGYSNIERLPKALDGDALTEALQGVRILGIRSRSQITSPVIDAANTLIAVGCFSVGTNQIDLDAARLKGIPVFNAPFSNTRSVAELTIAEIVMLFRRIFPRSVAAHEGGWEKSAAGSREVRGKTLGIVGYGNIGSQIAVLAESMGLRVIYHDHTDKLRHGNVEPAASLNDLLTRSDIVTLHVPETPATDRMIGAAEIARMKDGAFLINNSRGTVVNLDALATALQSRKLGGAAIDVFPVEPFHLASARCTKRHPDAACGRLHGRSPRAYRRGGHPQTDRVFRCRIDRGCRELSAGTALPSAGWHTLYSGTAEHAGRTRQTERSLRPLRR